MEGSAAHPVHWLCGGPHQSRPGNHNSLASRRRAWPELPLVVPPASAGRPAGAGRRPRWRGQVLSPILTVTQVRWAWPLVSWQRS